MAVRETEFAESETSDILARVSLMESLIEQGQSTTRRWGEFAVLWGVGSLAASLWQSFTGNWHSWLWLDGLGYPISLLLWMRRWQRHQILTQSAHFVNVLWMVTGVAMAMVGLVGDFSASFTARSITASELLLLGLANLISGLAFRWPLQTAIGAMFWLAMIAVPFFSGWVYFTIYCLAIFVGEVCFGIYLMVTERKHAYL